VERFVLVVVIQRGTKTNAQEFCIVISKKSAVCNGAEILVFETSRT
jgi:hypothetical protein